jgi:hypothetical protein
MKLFKFRRNHHPDEQSQMTQIPKDCYISSAVIVAQFKLDQNIRHSTAEIEKCYKEIVGGQAQVSNIPDDYPIELPRVAIQQHNKNLAISQISTQLTMNLDDIKTKDFKEQFSVVEKNAKKFWDATLKFKKVGDLDVLGLVVSTNIPSESVDPMVAVSNEIYDRFIKTDKLSEIILCDVRLGFISEMVYKNFSTAPYEIRATKPMIATQQLVTIKLEDMEVKESGRSFNFDVNNRPEIKAHGKSSVKSINYILDGMNELIFKDTSKLLGW